MRKAVEIQHALGPVLDITLDCEDGAMAGSEREHAALVAGIVASEANRFHRIGARVHHLGSPHFEEDVKTICSAADKLAYLVIPKVETVDSLLNAIDFIGLHSQRAGRESLPIHVLIETHGALAQVREIAALARVECLSFGIMDFVSSHYGAIPAEAMRSPAQFEHPLVMRAKLEIAAACHAFGKIPSHNVTTELSNSDAAGSDAIRAAREFGYTRMWSIHPDQIRPIVDAFRPSDAEAQQALAILLAARDADWGPIRHQGQLHDRASYRYYWTVLQRAKKSGIPLPDEAYTLQ